MKQTLKMTTGQHLRLAPQLQQAIRLLQLSNQALDTEIQALLDKNLFLELEQKPPVKQEVDLSRRNRNDPSEGYQEWLVNRASESSLREHLLSQLMMGGFSSRERLAALLIIDSINEAGYLEGSLEELQMSFTQQYPSHRVLSINELEALLQKIHCFEPIGVGARSLQECLRIQLLSLPKETVWLQEALHALQYLDLIGQRNYAELQKRLALTNEGLQGIIKMLRVLNPKPGLAWHSNQKSDYITPDLIVGREKDRFIAELNLTTVPTLRLNTEYIALMNQASTPQAASLLRAHFHEARHFLQALQHRQQVLLTVGQCIVDQQQDFFEGGAEKLKPLILQTIARMSGFHESTISRITTAKYLACPQGLFSLKYFFSSTAYASSLTTGPARSTKAIQAMMRKWIEAESSLEPLTDTHIMQKLADAAIPISRRTVTKYREKMQIPSSTERKSRYLFNNGEIPRRLYGTRSSDYRKKFKFDTHSQK